MLYIRCILDISASFSLDASLATQNTFSPIKNGIGFERRGLKTSFDKDIYNIMNMILPIGIVWEKIIFSENNFLIFRCLVQ